MINSTSQLNAIAKNIYNENASASLGKLTIIIKACRPSGIKFSFDEKYNDSPYLFSKKNFPDFNLEKTNQEIDYLASVNKYHEATTVRDEIKELNVEIQRQF